MNISDIRNMSDKELNHFLGMAQKNNHRICEKCGDFIIDKTTITVRKGYTTRTLCTLCNNFNSRLNNSMCMCFISD